MTIVREEENGNNGHHAGGVWRGGRCPSSLDTRAGALARFGRIDRSRRMAVMKCISHAAPEDQKAGKPGDRFVMGNWTAPPQAE